mgnify:CR=1 FL=1
MVGYGRMDLKEILSKMPSMKAHLGESAEEGDDKGFLSRQIFAEHANYDSFHCNKVTCTMKNSFLFTPHTDLILIMLLLWIFCS